MHILELQSLSETPMSHVALNIDFETEWLEPVSDDQYRG
jgi:hypothetical protein